MCLIFQGIYIKSTYDGLHVITGTTENVSVLLVLSWIGVKKYKGFPVSFTFKAPDPALLVKQQRRR